MTKMSNIFELEQQIMQCWHVVDDVEAITEWFFDSEDWKGMDPKVADAIANKYFGIKELYDVKFDKLFQTFEKVCKDYHYWRTVAGANRQEEQERMWAEFEQEYINDEQN